MHFIKPNWPAPTTVRAYTTTRQQGSSEYPYACFNLAKHVGDDESHVNMNRERLKATLQLPSDPIWMDQTHSNKVITVHSHMNMPIADAAITRNTNTVCPVLTADCLPILLCNHKGDIVSAIHAGWRGLASGIVENTVRAMAENISELMAWLGPAIGPEVYEVSIEVYDAFTRQDPLMTQAFKPIPSTPDKWLANLYQLATLKLNALGITQIFGGEFCTFKNEEQFYSYRRDGGMTGRMATLIWLSA